MIRPLSGLAALLLALALAAGAAGASTTLQPDSEKVYFAINCVRAPDGATCASTAYELSLQPGDSGVGQLGAVTPLDYVTYHTDGYRTQEFVPNATLDDSYILRTDESLTGVIELSGYQGTHFSVDSGVYVRILATEPGSFTPITLGEGEITKIVGAPGDTTYEFTFDVPADLDGTVVSSLSAEVGQRHITVLGSGFIRGQGESYFDLPIYEEVVAE